MSFETRLSWQVIALAALCVTFPFIESYCIQHQLLVNVRGIENFQASLLLLFALATYLYMRPMQLQEGKKQFWIWAVLWWVLLFGRSTSWGRDYFPEVPKIYFRGISVVLIGSVVFMLANKSLRAEIQRKYKTVSISVWGIVLTLFGLLVSDAIEHSRFLGQFFVHDLHYKDLMEELYEFPLIIGLYLVTLSVMKSDRSS